MKIDTFAAIDFETANSSRSSVCSVGIVVVEKGLVVNQIYKLIKPAPNFYHYINTQIHGISQFDTESAGDFRSVWSEIASEVQGKVFVAHNAPFDEGCLKAAFDVYNMSYPNYQFLCTCRAAKRALPHLPNHKLNTVSSYCGFDLTNHHHALADAQACAKIALSIHF